MYIYMYICIYIYMFFTPGYVEWMSDDEWALLQKTTEEPIEPQPGAVYHHFLFDHSQT